MAAMNQPGTQRPCKFKFCGLKTEDDVQLAIALGASAIGFVLSKSPRQIDAAHCARLCKLIPDTICTHAVFGPIDPAEITRLMQACGAQVAQVHGPEDDEAYWSALDGIPVIRAYRVKDCGILPLLAKYHGHPDDIFLLDAYVAGLAGGTGQQFDWTLAREASAYGKVILAGGLTPDNVADAIRTARPWMVDVSGGIEREKGVKCPELMREFASAIHHA